MKTKKPAKLAIPCLKVSQGKSVFAVLSISAKKLWSIVQINQRDPDKKTGYQRVLSQARVNSVIRYLSAGHPIPTSIIVSFSKTKFSADGKSLLVPNKPNSGWVIDGQHRLAGAFEAKLDIELPVVAFLNLAEEDQIKQFVKINKEAKNVPSSLYLDLLKHLPDKSDADMAKERAVDIAENLRKEDDSPFSGKISVIAAPQPGELSLTNFVRKVSPLVGKKGKFHVYSVNDQIGIIKNYYHALEHVFPDIYRPKDGISIFFKTLGFGALMNVLPTIFDLSLKHHNNVKVESLSSLLKAVDDFNFEDWESIGTGTEAENAAAADLRETLMERVAEAEGGDGSSLIL